MSFLLFVDILFFLLVSQIQFLRYEYIVWLNILNGTTMNMNTLRCSTSGFDFHVIRRQEIPVNCSTGTGPSGDISLTFPFFFWALLTDFADDPDPGDIGDNTTDWSSIAWACWACCAISIRLRRHSSSYILISHIRVTHASSQLLPRLSFRTLFKFRP